MVLMAGPDQVDWKKLRQLVKRSRIRMATEEEVLDVTGYRIGTVSPFGLKNQISSGDRHVRLGGGNFDRIGSPQYGDHHEE